ncbi:MAG TPA: hypothetical protein VGK87_12135 [Anaerolineae bacterium]
MTIVQQPPNNLATRLKQVELTLTNPTLTSDDKVNIVLTRVLPGCCDTLLIGQEEFICFLPAGHTVKHQSY